MTKSEAASNSKSNIYYKSKHYKSKWCFDPQIIGGYYHDGCLVRPMPMINGNGAAYSKFDYQYRYCPNCGEPMFEEVLDND